VRAAGAQVGIIGVTTIETMSTTIAANVADLIATPLAEAVAGEAHRLRAGGADVIVVAAHAGGHCKQLDDPHDLSTCEADAEIFALANALAPGTVDVIVAGHTHRGIAHVVNGTAIIESFAYGRAFGRVDVVVAPGAMAPTRVEVMPTQSMCREAAEAKDACDPGEYEGRPVVPDARVAAAIAPYLERTEAVRSRELGVTLAAPLERSYRAESPLGNLFVDLMLAAHPAATVALTNGGGLRADLPAGSLTYGALHTASPFDNRFALITLTGAQLARVMAMNLAASDGFLSIGGARVVAMCAGDVLRVRVTRPNGRPFGDDETLTVVASDFLATVTDGAFAALNLPEDAIRILDGPGVRDAMAAQLEARGGTLRPTDVFDPKARRVVHPGERPVTCN
jgi:5'-nucleotidase